MLEGGGCLSFDWYIIACQVNYFQEVQVDSITIWFFLSDLIKGKSWQKKEKRCSAVCTRILMPGVSHSEPVLTTQCYSCIGYAEGGNIHHIHTAGTSVSIKSRTMLLTKQNDLAIFGYSTRKACTDTCRQAWVTNSFLMLNCFILQIEQYTPEWNKALWASLKARLATQSVMFEK